MTTNKFDKKIENGEIWKSKFETAPYMKPKLSFK